MRAARFRSSLASKSPHSGGGSAVWCTRALTTGGGSTFTGGRAASMHFGVDPAKLRLDLDLDKMDFAKMAEATQEAISHDRNAHRQRKDETQTLDAAIAAEAAKQREAETSNSDADPFTETSQPRKTSAFAAGETHEQRSVRGIAGAGGVHDENSPAAAYAQRRRETSRDGAGRADVRYTLMDSLRDCSVNGNWHKAYRLFEQAVDKAVGMIVAPPAVPQGSTSDETLNGARAKTVAQKEKEVFQALSKITAALPPPPPATSSQWDRSSAAARRRNMNHLAGVMRWHGGHYLLLLKSLFASGRIEEAERVWAAMQGIGFVQYQMDERTVNSLVSLLRRIAQREDAAQHLVTPIVPTARVSELREREKTLSRNMMVTLEDVARSRKLRLRGANERTATVARIAAAMHHQDTAAVSHKDREDAVEEQTASQGDGDVSPAPTLHVGDFNGLLRVAQSHEGTMRIVSMMEKLAIPMDATTYANIIASHRNPKYRVQGATEEDIASLTEEHEDLDRGESSPHEEPKAPVNEETKRAYEAYKDKRIASARKWFDMCPPAERSAALYNEMLYLLRASKHTEEFDTLLSAFRGNALRTPEDWAIIDRINAKTQESREVGEEGTPRNDDVPATPLLMAPSWTVKPNGRTYELLIRRCRYRHDWEGMWSLFEEMQAADVRGTPKLYQMLMADARSHPPLAVARHSDVSSFIMHLYHEMRRHRIDVSSVGSTVNLVNAWSATRSKRRWS